LLVQLEFEVEIEVCVPIELPNIEFDADVPEPYHKIVEQHKEGQEN